MQSALELLGSRRRRADPRTVVVTIAVAAMRRHRLRSRRAEPAPIDARRLARARRHALPAPSDASEPAVLTVDRSSAT